MYLALREIWRSKLKFGLLSGAVALLVFLLLFLGTLSGTLLSSYIGAIENVEADLLVFSEDASRNVQASRFDPSIVREVEQVPGVAAASGLSEATLTVEVGGAREDLSLWGTVAGAPGDVPIVEGRAAAEGEVVMDRSAEGLGFTIGSSITLVETGRTLEIVGFTESRQYSVLPTGYTPSTEWDAIFFATYPGAQVSPVSVIAADVERGTDPTAVSAEISRFLAAADAATPAEAAGSAPGVSSIETSFNLIVGITFGIVVVVIGFFFTILAVQKQTSFALLRAVGSTRSYLAASIAIQIVVTIVTGTAIAISLLMVTGRTSSPSFPLAIDATAVAMTALVVLVFSVLSGVFAIRRALRIDPVAAAQGVA
jgi:putative ABC transport system permease protein